MRVVPGAAGAPAAVDFATGLLSPRLLSRGADRVEVALVATGATLLGGDHVRIAVDVGAGIRLDLRDVAATVAYHGRGEVARISVRVRLGEGARMVWWALPLVVSEGARVRRSLDITLAAGARAVLRDTLALGRSGERAGTLDCRTTVVCEGEALLTETLALGADAWPGMLGGARVVDSVLALGWRPDLPSARAGTGVFELAGPGTVVRALLGEAHRSPLDNDAAAWATQL